MEIVWLVEMFHCNESNEWILIYAAVNSGASHTGHEEE